MRATRQRWINLFADYNVRIELVYLEQLISQLQAQNRQRREPVPRRVLERLLGKLEPPTITEAHALTVDST